MIFVFKSNLEVSSSRCSGLLLQIRDLPTVVFEMWRHVRDTKIANFNVLYEVANIYSMHAVCIVVKFGPFPLMEKCNQVAIIFVRKVTALWTNEEVTRLDFCLVCVSVRFKSVSCVFGVKWVYVLHAFRSNVLDPCSVYLERHISRSTCCNFAKKNRKILILLFDRRKKFELYDTSNDV